jgi:hypothetical protein
VKKVNELESEHLKERDHLGDISIDVRIILKFVLERYGVICELDSSGSGWKPVAGSCENSSIKSR